MTIDCNLTLIRNAFFIIAATYTVYTHLSGTAESTPIYNSCVINVRAKVKLIRGSFGVAAIDFKNIP